MNAETGVGQETGSRGCGLPACPALVAGAALDSRMFSPEGGRGLRFITRSRSCEADEPKRLEEEDVP